MAKHELKIDINGEGSDEQFLGYGRYRILYWLDRMYDDPHLSEYLGIAEAVLGKKDEIAARMLVRGGMDFGKALTVSKKLSASPLMYRAAAVDRYDGLPPLIEHEKAVAAHWGLTHRWPFMSAAIQEYSLKLPTSQLVNAVESKVVLRDVARALGVHRDIVEEKTKKGLFVPTQWRDDGEPPYSRAWFDRLMADAWAKVKPEIGNDRR
jgi:asparagine synthetase B (glutamine-hydrolysing)